MNPAKFKKEIWKYYKVHKREMPWRNTANPYHIVVSEIMLQQTQVSRVVPKYTSFIAKFPTWKKLAEAPLKDILLEWQGLGYNRRGKALHNIAQKITKEYKGTLPHDPALLETFPSIGPNTAGSICTFTFNLPVVFIETNIRTVFIHFFFEDKEKIDDKDILKLVEKTLDKKNPREWYYALMDYGAFLKSHNTNINEKSAHHKKQTTFKGSNREIRSHILKALLVKSSSSALLSSTLNYPLDIIEKNLHVMQKEKILSTRKNLWYVA